MRSWSLIYISWIAFVAVVVLSSSALATWHARWDFSASLKPYEKDVIFQCVAEDSSTSKELERACCVCHAIVHKIEEQLNNTKNDHEMDVVFRISEQKKKIAYSRSEGRILEVLDDVCENIHSAILMKENQQDNKMNLLLYKMCEGFVHEFEQDITLSFWDNHSPAKHRVCETRLKVCGSGNREKDDL